VPLIVRAPGAQEAGSVCRMPVSHVQLLPSLAEWSGVAMPGDRDGESFARQVRKPLDVQPATIYAEYALGSRSAKYMMRHGDLKYTFRTHDSAELYDLASDPQEIRNLAREKTFEAR